MAIILICFIGSLPYTFTQITININSNTAHIKDNTDIYIAGNINGWNPKDPKYKLKKTDSGKYQISFAPPIGTIEYKFTKGSWGTVEITDDGLDTPNRILAYNGEPHIIDITIAGWKDEATIPKPVSSTAAENVSILNENFHIPQLGRDRKIWVYLPPDYDSTDKSYPVLYMHDAQNIFDSGTSFSGEWNVDESLNDLFSKGDEGVIVIGIENGEEFRIEEYTPWSHPKHGGGSGHKYVDFIVQTLKPHVDANFRTKSDRLHTGIMGSSLGGLITFYAAIKHQDIFSKAGVFSPSFWFSDEVYNLVDTIGKVHDMKIYLLGGALESDELIDEINAMVTTLKYTGFAGSEIKMITHKDGKHNEQYWSREFQKCYMWLFE